MSEQPAMTPLEFWTEVLAPSVELLRRGRWKRGSVPEAPESTGSGNTWQARMTEAGLVYDYCPERTDPPTRAP